MGFQFGCRPPFQTGPPKTATRPPRFIAELLLRSSPILYLSVAILIRWHLGHRRLKRRSLVFCAAETPVGSAWNVTYTPGRSSLRVWTILRGVLSIIKLEEVIVAIGTSSSQPGNLIVALFPTRSVNDSPSSNRSGLRLSTADSSQFRSFLPRSRVCVP